MRILHYPFIRTQAELNELYHRASWYLPDMEGHTVVFPFHDHARTPGEPPEPFGVQGNPQFDCEYPVVRDNPQVMSLLNRADFILLWRDDLNRMERYNLEGLSKRMLNVSKASDQSRHEAYHSAILRHELMTPDERRTLVDENHARLQKLAPSLRADKAYVFGTGPSLAMAMDMDFSDGLGIVCNTTVRNEDLLNHIRPRIIVAADPALHFGVSRYAAAFREHLARAMQRYDAWLFLPLGYYPMFIRHYPDLAERTIGVPVVPEKPENVSVDLVEHFQIACYANILTLFLLPLGATLAQEVVVLGCDGRAPQPNANDGNPSPFWQHHQPSEFAEVYDTLKQCHPSFFMMDYTDWYRGHCEGVRVVVEAVEHSGRKVRVQTPSYIPCLAERLDAPHRTDCIHALETASVQNTPYEFALDTRKRASYRVSVIVSLYKAERFVAPMLRNLISQTLFYRGEVEILLIDSASPGNDIAEARPFIEVNPHIFYGRTRERETVYGAFNRAIHESRGQYIMNLDTDNRLRNDALEIFAKALDDRPDVGLVYGNQYIGQFENESFYDHVRFGRCRRPRFSRDMMLHKYYFGSELMWRRELHDKVGDYDTSYVVAGDYEMVCRMATVTDFLHVDRYFGLYLKNLKGIEYTNLELCESEDDRIRKEYANRFPVAVDPPRVHVHYPIAAQAPNDYLTIVCHAMSFDQPITRPIMKLYESLEFPFILYALEQNSSQATRNSIAHLAAEGLVVPGDGLLPHVRSLFEHRIAYTPTLRFLLLAHGEIRLLDKDFLAMKRHQLTAYFKSAHLELTSPFRTSEGKLDPLKVPTFGDYHEFERLDLTPHFAIDNSAARPGLDVNGLTVCIQHYAPASQEKLYRDALKRCVNSVRDQACPFPVQVVVCDDGSFWSSELAGSDPKRLIAVHGRDSLAGRPAFADLDVDLYLYKSRTGYFSKGVLWEAARSFIRTPGIVYLDDDHHFLRPDSLARFANLLGRYELVVGHTREYAFKDIDGVRHRMPLGYTSPVVQGSNFAIRRELLAAAGGFDPRTFLWGTGDDPALFWKLYLMLRPQAPGADRRACYAEEIVTENPYSGRWREDCRVDLELFIRDFLRLYGVHPNSNPSRDRTSWMDFVPDPQARTEEQGGAPANISIHAGGRAITVVVPAQGADPKAVWLTVAAILDQRLPEPHRIVVTVSHERKDGLEDILPRAVELNRTDSASPGEAVLRCLQSVDTPLAGWVLPGTVLAEKVLKGALTLLRDTGADLVWGGHCSLDREGLRIRHATPPDLCLESLPALLADWQPGQPVFGRSAVLAGLAPESDMHWDMALLLNALRQGARGLSKDQLFSLHPFGSPAPLSAEEGAALALARLDDTTLKLTNRLIIGGISRQRHQHELSAADGEERLRILPWYREICSRLDWIRRIFDAAIQTGIKRLAVYGPRREVEILATVFWPRSLELSALVLDQPGNDTLAGVPIIDLNTSMLCDALLPANREYEDRLSHDARWVCELAPLYRPKRA